MRKSLGKVWTVIILTSGQSQQAFSGYFHLWNRNHVASPEVLSYLTKGAHQHVIWAKNPSQSCIAGPWSPGFSSFKIRWPTVYPSRLWSPTCQVILRRFFKHLCWCQQGFGCVSQIHYLHNELSKHLNNVTHCFPAKALDIPHWNKSKGPKTVTTILDGGRSAFQAADSELHLNPKAWRLGMDVFLAAAYCRILRP